MPMVLSLLETAKELRLSNDTTTRLLELGEIKAYRDGRNWKVPKTLLAKYVEERAIKESKARKKAYEEGTHD